SPISSVRFPRSRSRCSPQLLRHSSSIDRFSFILKSPRIHTSSVLPPPPGSVLWRQRFEHQQANNPARVASSVVARQIGLPSTNCRTPHPNGLDGFFGVSPLSGGRARG